jgi:hypothetical protein
MLPKRSAPASSTVGRTRVCPHCKATILESAAICPQCKHHLQFGAAVYPTRKADRLPRRSTQGAIHEQPRGQTGSTQSLTIRTGAARGDLASGRQRQRVRPSQLNFTLSVDDIHSGHARSRYSRMIGDMARCAIRRRDCASRRCSQSATLFRSTDRADMIPFFDEMMLALGTLLLGSMRKRRPQVP